MQQICKIDVKKIMDITISLNELVTEANYIFNSNGLNITVMDPANVCLTNAKIERSCFLELAETEHKFSLNILSLLSVLKTNKKEIVSISINDLDLNSGLFLSFSNGLTAKIPLIDFYEKEIKIPELTQKSIITADSKNFKQSILKFKDFEAVMFNSMDNKFFISGTNNLINQSIPLIALNQFDGSTCKYSVEYLISIVKVLLNSKIQIKFNTDYPLEIIQHENGVSLYHILAPRVLNN